jgi:hypothetical protein
VSVFPSHSGVYLTRGASAGRSPRLMRQWRR